MKRSEFIAEMSKLKGMSYKKSSQAVNAVMDTIRVVLLNGDDVEIGGFGTFSIITDLKGERIPFFQSGKTLRNVLNTFENGKKESNG